MLHGLDQRTASIYAPVQEGLARVEEKLRTLADTENSPVQPLLQYVTDAGGKRVRPAVTLLAAQFHPHDPDPLRYLLSINMPESGDSDFSWSASGSRNRPTGGPTS